jgi:triosephosphate isomerase
MKSTPLSRTRKSVFAANWKMYKTASDATAFIRRLLGMSIGTETEIILFPSMTVLPAATEACQNSNIRVGAQNMHWLESGPYTGETSPPMLLALGCTHVLIGHSERRRYFNESDKTVNLKLKSALGHGLIPVVCVGENKDERDAGRMTAILQRQVESAMYGATPASASQVIFAYEPLWAIGTGDMASPATAEDAHKKIRNIIESLFGSLIARQTRILYGGSVKPENASDLLSSKDVDGALVGGASLDPDSFSEIIRSATSGLRAAPSRRLING